MKQTILLGIAALAICSNAFSQTGWSLHASPNDTVLIFEAETGVMSSGTVDNDNPGYTGTGFVNLTNAMDTYLEVTVNLPSTGVWDILFRYANGSASNRICEIQMDGKRLQNLDFNSTGSWATWNYSSPVVRLTLSEGSHKLKIIGKTDESAPNLDHIKFSLLTTQPTGTIEVNLYANGYGSRELFYEKEWFVTLHDTQWQYFKGHWAEGGIMLTWFGWIFSNIPVGNYYVEGYARFQGYFLDPLEPLENPWRSEYYNNTHSQSAATLVTVTASDTTRITMNLEWTTFIEIYTRPNPIPFTVDGTVYTIPKIFDWDQGSVHTLSVDEYVDIPGEDPPRFVFKEWKHGGSRVQNYTVPAPQFCTIADSLVARFDNYKTMVINTHPKPFTISVDNKTCTAPATFRWKPSETHLIGVEEYYDLPGDPIRYVFREWRHGGSRIQNYSVPVPVAGRPVDSLVAQFDYYSQLDVQSKYGHPHGSGWHKTWTQVTFSVEDSVIEYSDHTFKFLKSTDPAARDSLLHLFDCWEGTGHLAYSGKNNPGTVSLYGTTVEKAKWIDKFPLSVSSSDTVMGTVSIQPAGLWQFRDSTVTVRAQPKKGNRFVRWEGSRTDTASVISVKMDTSKKMIARFEKSSTGVDEETAQRPASDLPKIFALYQNYPNPFNPDTEIRFDVPRQEHMRIEVFSLMGKQISVLADAVFEPGQHQVHWNGTNHSGEKMGSGIFLSVMTAGDFVWVVKMILIK